MVASPVISMGVRYVQIRSINIEIKRLVWSMNDSFGSKENSQTHYWNTIF